MIVQSLAVLLACSAGAQRVAYDSVDRMAPITAELPKAPKRATLSESAASALETFKQLGRLDPKAMGFASAAEVEQATLGEPLPIYEAKAGDVAAFDGTTDPNAVLKHAGQVLVPVLSRGQAKASILLQRTNTGWRVGPIGEGPDAKAISSAIAALGAKTQNELRFLVHMGALKDSWFAARRADGQNVQDPDPTLAATELVAIKDRRKAALCSWLKELSAPAKKAVKWSREVGGQDPTPPGPVIGPLP